MSLVCQDGDTVALTFWPGPLPEAIAASPARPVWVTGAAAACAAGRTVAMAAARASAPGPVGGRPPGRSADKLIDELAEPRHGRGDIGPRPAGAEAIRRGAGLVEQAGQDGVVFGQPDPAQAGQLAAEVHLMIVDHLAEPAKARNDDRHPAPLPGVSDRARAAMANDHVRPVQQPVKLAGLEERGARAGRAEARAARLHEELAGQCLMLAEPVVDPADQAIERMVVGADGDDEARRVTARPAGSGRAGHSRHPITLPRG